MVTDGTQFCAVCGLAIPCAPAPGDLSPRTVEFLFNRDRLNVVRGGQPGRGPDELHDYRADGPRWTVTADSPAPPSISKVNLGQHPVEGRGGL